MQVKLSEHFTYSKLLRFTFPSVVMMVFTSIYGVVDGIFVSNFVGKTSFAALNLIMPFLMLFSTLGFMIGTGGSALVARTLGEGDTPKANRQFSLLIYVTVGLGLLLTATGLLLLRPVSVALGAEGEMLEDCVIYGTALLPGLMPFMLQNTFQSFLVAAEKPKLGLAITVAAGFTNIALDALFIAVLDWGLAGAAAATSLSQCVGGFIPLLYFSRPNRSLLRLGRTQWQGRTLYKACTNGSSEMMTNLSMSLVNMLYNAQLMRFAGEDGVAAYGVIMYVNFIFIAIYIGYSIGSAPIISYHYGAQNHDEMRNMYGKSIRLMTLVGAVLTVLAVLLAEPLAGIFVGYDQALFAMTKRGFMLYALSFFFMGYNIFGSSFFTALNDGLISAVISFLRTLLFQVAAVLLLPLVLQLDGIWLAIVAAEGASLAVTAALFVKMRKKYHY